MDAWTPTLTLAELRAAGHAGWKDNYLYVEGTVFRIIARSLSSGVYDIRIEPSALSLTHSLLLDGWYRMPHAEIA